MDDDELVVVCARSGRILEAVALHGTISTALAVVGAGHDAGVRVLPLGEARSRHEGRFKAAPWAICRERYNEMRQMLAPFDLSATGDVETFRHAEVIAGSIVPIFVRMGDRYFEMAESMMLSHADIVAKVMVSPAWRDGSGDNGGVTGPLTADLTRTSRK